MQRYTPRLAFTAGDMFEAVPEADGYLMKHILHDWNDEEYVEILGSIRESAPAHECGGGGVA